MTSNQYNFMSNAELSAVLFDGAEICLNVSKALNFRRFLVENFPDIVENVDFSSYDPFVYIKHI